MIPAIRSLPPNHVLAAIIMKKHSLVAINEGEFTRELPRSAMRILP
jgi:hypothetical protein